MKKLLAHLNIVLSGMILTLLCIDRVNTAMRFIDNAITKGILFALCAVSILSGMICIAQPGRKRK